MLLVVAVKVVVIACYALFLLGIIYFPRSGVIAVTTTTNNATTTALIVIYNKKTVSIANAITYKPHDVK